MSSLLEKVEAWKEVRGESMKQHTTKPMNVHLSISTLKRIKQHAIYKISSSYLAFSQRAISRDNKKKQISTGYKFLGKTLLPLQNHISSRCINNIHLFSVKPTKYNI